MNWGKRLPFLLVSARRRLIGLNASWLRSMTTWQYQFFKRRRLLIGVALALTTLIAFSQVRECAFVNYDDDIGGIF